MGGREQEAIGPPGPVSDQNGNGTTAGTARSWERVSLSWKRQRPKLREGCRGPGGQGWHQVRLAVKEQAPGQSLGAGARLCPGSGGCGGDGDFPQPSEGVLSWVHRTT